MGLMIQKVNEKWSVSIRETWLMSRKQFEEVFSFFHLKSVELRVSTFRDLVRVELCDQKMFWNEFSVFQTELDTLIRFKNDYGNVFQEQGRL